MSGVLPTKNGLLIPPIKTPDNTLDDGSGNATIAGALSVEGGVAAASVSAPAVSGAAGAFSGALPPVPPFSGTQGAALTWNLIPPTTSGGAWTVGSGGGNFTFVNQYGDGPGGYAFWDGPTGGPWKLLATVAGAGSATPGAMTLAGGLTANGIALAVTPSVATLATNPPVSGTPYQWAGPGTLQLACPITLNPTTTAAATAALNIGPTSSLGNQMDYSSRPAGLTGADGETETLKVQIPAGWYYGLTVVNATIGTCVAIAS